MTTQIAFSFFVFKKLYYRYAQIIRKEVAHNSFHTTITSILSTTQIHNQRPFLL